MTSHPLNPSLLVGDPASPQGAMITSLANNLQESIRLLAEIEALTNAIIPVLRDKPDAVAAVLDWRRRTRDFVYPFLRTAMEQKK